MMVKHIPDILKVMSPFPNHITTTATVAEAFKLASSQKVEFLVVVDDKGEPLGILYFEMLEVLVASNSEWSVSRIMSKQFVVVDAHEPFDRVLEVLASDKLPMALVTHKGKLSGSFSYADCARLLKQAIHNKPITPEPPDMTA